MVKAAALYIVVIISLMIAVISVSLLSVAFYYRLENQKKNRFDRLQTNLESGTAILLSPDFAVSEFPQGIDLYEDQQDSVLLQKLNWGIYTLNTLKTFEQHDTLRRAFLSGTTYTNSAAIYMADEDRPLSLSGNTQLIGDGDLPKSGLRQSYVDGKPYAGKSLIYGKMRSSGRDLPALDEKLMATILEYFTDQKNTSPLPTHDSISNSFFNPVMICQLKPNQTVLSGKQFAGKMILIADSIVTIEADMALQDIMIYAPAILVKDGFKGSCQLYARDSIIIGKRCEFNYPSFAGVFKPDTSKIQSKVCLGPDSKFSGILLSYEKKRSDLQTMVSLGKGSLVKGEIFAVGYIKMDAPIAVSGTVYAKRFLMEKSSAVYENYLIDVVFNRKLLSKHYLSSPLINSSTKSNQILRWLN
jgi:hypothetical protein